MEKDKQKYANDNSYPLVRIANAIEEILRLVKADQEKINKNIWRNKKMMSKKYIHINQHIIKSNAKSGDREPVITVKTYKTNNYGHEVEINGPCRVVYSPDKPLSCGAKVWIETEAGVVVVDKNQTYVKDVA
jgi:hypothetical protein